MNIDIEKSSYKERLCYVSNSFYTRLEQLYQDEEELDKVVSDLSEASVVYEAVYTEIGMKFGARIIFQLLNIDYTM